MDRPLLSEQIFTFYNHFSASLVKWEVSFFYITKLNCSLMFNKQNSLLTVRPWSIHQWFAIIHKIFPSFLFYIHFIFPENELPSYWVSPLDFSLILILLTSFKTSEHCNYWRKNCCSQ